MRATELVSPETASAIEEASSERDLAMREARQESDRLREALSPGLSEASASPPPTATDPESGARSEATGGGFDPSEPAAVGSVGLPSSVEGSAGAGKLGGRVGELSVTSPAPPWTVGYRLRDEHEATDEDRDDVRARRGERGFVVAMNRPRGRPARLFSDGPGEACSGEGHGAPAGGDGLAGTERRYEVGPAGLGGRAREVGGMVGRRTGGGERAHRRKLGAVAAAAGYRLPEVRE